MPRDVTPQLWINRRTIKSYRRIVVASSASVRVRVVVVVSSVSVRAGGMRTYWGGGDGRSRQPGGFFSVAILTIFSVVEGKYVRTDVLVCVRVRMCVCARAYVWTFVSASRSLALALIKLSLPLLLLMTANVVSKSPACGLRRQCTLIIVI